jgi:hypothetical protein
MSGEKARMRSRTSAFWERVPTILLAAGSPAGSSSFCADMSSTSWSEPKSSTCWRA